MQAKNVLGNRVDLTTLWGGTARVGKLIPSNSRPS
jgi:hypothetical protein